MLDRLASPALVITFEMHSSERLAAAALPFALACHDTSPGCSPTWLDTPHPEQTCVCHPSSQSLLYLCTTHMRAHVLLGHSSNVASSRHEAMARRKGNEQDADLRKISQD